MDYSYTYHLSDVFDTVVSRLRVHHVQLLCTDSGLWEMEMEEEVIYILSKSGFSIFSHCYCLESTVPVHDSLACVSLVPFPKGEKINMGIFCSENSYSVKSNKFPLFLLMKPQTH